MDWHFVGRKISNYKYEPIQDFKTGRDSGYHLCCVTWYLIRNIRFTIRGKLGFIPVAQSKDRTKERNKYQHILCPYHQVFLPKPRIYYTCPSCNWMQFQNNKCNNCGNIIDNDSTFFRKS